jgi:hypothetical protein
VIFKLKEITMFKKSVYGIIASGLMFAAQGALAMTDHAPVVAQADNYVYAAPTQYRFEGTPAAVITAIPANGEASPLKHEPARIRSELLASNNPFPPSVD